MCIRVGVAQAGSSNGGKTMAKKTLKKAKKLEQTKPLVVIAGLVR
jgi:hypothetical protein